jgi:hypothetical protein
MYPFQYHAARSYTASIKDLLFKFPTNYSILKPFLLKGSTKEQVYDIYIHIIFLLIA